jgi:hypothetical protein
LRVASGKNEIDESACLPDSDLQIPTPNLSLLHWQNPMIIEFLDKSYYLENTESSHSSHRKLSLYWEAASKRSNSPIWELQAQIYGFEIIWIPALP